MANRRRLSPSMQRAAARRAAQRREAQRRRRIQIGAVVVVVAVVAALVIAFTGTGSNDATPSATATGSAAGKPCVKVKDKLPSGAPAVPVQTGKPPTKLVKRDLKPGSGAAVQPGATVTVNYIGVACSTGKIFDSSYTRQPATFPLTGVIRGWQDGIPGMKVGGRRLLGIPSDEAYGPQGRPPTIRPNEALWFVVEVLDTKAS